MRTIFVGSLALLTILAGSVAAHGGRYRGPAGEVPPASQDPHRAEPVRPPEPVSPGRPRAHRPTSFDHWLFWWHLNKDALLEQRIAPRLRDRDPLLDRLAGRAVVPALRRAAANEALHPDIRAGAAIALARCGEPASTREFLMGLAGSEDVYVGESAVLGLALTGDPGDEGRELLIRCADDSTRRWRQRCFALAALGLDRKPAAGIDAGLMHRAGAAEPAPDLPVAALFATGLRGRRSAVPWLLRKLGGDPDALELSWIATALGRCAGLDRAPVLLRLLGHESPAVRRAAAIALGWLGTRPGSGEAHDRILDALSLSREADGDELTGNLCLISAARIGNAAARGSALRRRAFTILAAAFRDGDASAVRPWAALGLGLLAADLDRTDRTDRALWSEIVAPLREDLRRLRGDKVARAAGALALGLARDDGPETVRTLLAVLRDRGQEPKLRGAAAVALGLIGAPEARAPVLASLAEREDRRIRLDTALAAGLLGGEEAVPALIHVFQDPTASQFVLGSAATALGWLGDPRAVRPLLTILEAGRGNGEYPDLARALAASALGLNCDRHRGPSLSRLSTDFPWRSSVPALEELLTIL